MSENHLNLSQFCYHFIPQTEYLTVSPLLPVLIASAYLGLSLVQIPTPRQPLLLIPQVASANCILTPSLSINSCQKEVSCTIFVIMINSDEARSKSLCQLSNNISFWTRQHQVATGNQCHWQLWKIWPRFGCWWWLIHCLLNPIRYFK